MTGANSSANAEGELHHASRRVDALVLLLCALVAGCDSGGSTSPAGSVLFEVSGTVAGDVQEGVTITLGGADSGVDTTSGAGDFTFKDLVAGSYTLTPSKPGYTFSPTAAEVTLSGTDSPENDFVSTAVTLSGTVIGDIADGVPLYLTGDMVASVDTSGGGTYVFSEVIDGSFTITPSLTGYVFTPVSRSVVVAGGVSEGGLDFTATAIYTLSGTVSGDVADNVTVTLGGAASDAVTTNSAGDYSFPGLFAGSYTVTPSLAGYTFSPATQAPVITAADVTGVDFASTAVEISGTVSGHVFLNVTILLSGAAGGSTSTNFLGNYSFSPVPDGAYSVTPLRPGYTFSPASAAVNIAGGTSSTGNDFASAAVTLSGTVSGDVTGGVSLRVTGAGAGSVAVNPVTTSGSGSYMFSPVVDGSTTITPSLVGYAFSPPSRTVPVSGASQGGLDFTSTAVSLSGTVGGDIADGVTVTLSGAGTDTQVTSGGGDFSFDRLPDGSYTLVPSLAGYTFSPAYRTVNVSGASQTGLDFTSTSRYEIYGTVTGDVQEGVTMILGGAGSGSVTTDGSGDYTFPGLVPGSYTVTPQLYGYSFSPATRTPTIVTSDATGVDFTSAALPTYTISGTVSGLAGTGLVLQNNGGDDEVIPADGAFSFTTPVPDGYGYDVTVLTHPSSTDQTCVVMRGSGTVSGADVTDVEVRCGNARYVFVANVGEDTVSSYVVDDASGRLELIGTAPTGSTPYSVAVDPSGQHAYVANFGSGNVSQYTVGAGGELTPKSIPTVPAGSSPQSVTVHPSGSYAYVANAFGNSVSQYTIGAGGGLEPMIPPTVATEATPFSVAVDPSGQYAYVTNTNSDTISQYTIGLLGDLTPMAVPTVPTGSGPYVVTVDPTGRYAYALNYGGDDISQYTIEGDGSLTPMASPTVSGVSNPISAAVDPSGRYVYVVNYTGISVSQYRIGSDGALSLMAVPLVVSGANPAGVVVDPTGRYVYVSDSGDHRIFQYMIGPTGELSFNHPIAVPSRAIPYPVAISGGEAAPVPVPKYAYATNSLDDTVSQYSIGADGTLTALATPTVSTGTAPVAIAVDPTRQYAYVANSGDATVSQYTIGADGSLSPMTPATVAAGTSPRSIAVDASGRFAYAANAGDDTVSLYTLGSDGTLSPNIPATVSTGDEPFSVVVHPDGWGVYVVNRADGTVSQYLVSSADGTLSENDPPTVAAGANPRQITIDRSARYAYVANESAASLSQYLLLVGNAARLSVNDSVTAGIGPYGVTVEPWGMFAYAVNFMGSTVSQYSVDESGLLSALTPPQVSTGNGPASLHAGPSGRFLYVTNEGDDTISQYSIGVDGTLAPLTPATVGAGDGPSQITIIGDYE